MTIILRRHANLMCTLQAYFIEHFSPQGGLLKKLMLHVVVRIPCLVFYFFLCFVGGCRMVYP